jgi:hypothetical protein
MESRRSRAGLLRKMHVCVVAAIAALAVALVPAQASAASPVLEFLSPGHSFPMPFEADGATVSARLADFDRIVNCGKSEGDGEITGPHSTISNYVFTECVAELLAGGGSDVECQSDGADAEEIRSGTIEADLVYLDQAKHEVAMLLNPDEGVYMEFECGGESVKAFGSFLSPVDPINKMAPSFTAVLERDGNAQLPSEYEAANGEKRQAIPMGEVNNEPPDSTGVELTFTVQPEFPLEIKAINTAEVEAKQREDEATKKREADEAAALAAAKKRQDDEAAAAKKRQDDEAALAAAKQKEEAEAKARKQHLTKALKQCKKVKSGQKRARCVKRANKKYGAPKGYQQAKR